MKPLAAALLVAFGLPASAGEYTRLEQLGEALFHDVDLSLNRTQSCATCHSPDFGFVDPRESAAGRAVSLGDDGVSLGDRNAPTVAYAMFSPRFEKLDPGIYRGGQFHDGREPDLEGQAGGPFLNPLEMAMPDRAGVLARVAEKPEYVAAFDALFAPGVLDDEAAGYRALTEAIAAFERTPLFAPFDSKYDRFLRGEARLTDEEELGRLLFFSEQFTNCNLCHQLRVSPIAPDETFSTYEYHNIGVPANRAVRALNGVREVDHGLLANPAVDEPSTDGRFKVPTLRNVAVTGPYMHNGVFADLRTVVLFYNVYNTRDGARLINPETGLPFEPPEVPGTLSMPELTHGPALDDKRIDALVAFLETLTDARYEPLLGD